MVGWGFEPRAAGWKAKNESTGLSALTQKDMSTTLELLLPYNLTQEQLSIHFQQIIWKCKTSLFTNYRFGILKHLINAENVLTNF